MITCHLREANFQKSLLAELGCGARSFAGDTEGCCVGRAWCGRAVARPRGPGGTRESRSKPGYTENGIAVKILNDTNTATMLPYNLIRIYKGGLLTPALAPRIPVITEDVGKSRP